MVGARSLAMALNRLIDAEIDARNPRTAARELPAGRSRARRCSRFCAVVARASSSSPSSSSTRSCAGSGRSRSSASSSTRTSSASPGSATSGSAPSTGSRRSARGSRSRGELPWEAWALGGAVALWVAGFDLFYSLLRRRESTARRGCTRGRRASASAASSRARACCTSLTVALLAAAGLGLDVGVFYWLGVARRRGAARLRALARPARRPAPARRRVLHGERRDQHRLLRLRARATCSL